MALPDTLALEGRLLYPEIAGQRRPWDAALNAVAEGFRRAIAETGPGSVAFYVSGQLLTEDYYVANKLMKGFIGAANIDTNSRLCMSSSVAGHVRAFGEDVVPGCYADLEQANMAVLVGSNAAWCHPVLYQRLRQAKADRPALKVVVIDPRRTPTCEIAGLHLALRPGTEGWLFNGLLHHLAQAGCADAAYVRACTEGAGAALEAAAESSASIGQVARACGLSERDVEEFFRSFAETEAVVTLYSQGIHQSSSGSDKVNAILNCHLLTGRIGRPGMGPFSLTGQPNAMGGREVGGLANQLAAHLKLEDALDRDRVRRFWNAPRIAERPGLKAVELFESVGRGAVRALWIMGTNPAASMPDAERVREAIQRCPFVVVSDLHGDTDTARLAHVRLPALAWGEKEGTVTNSERCISRQRGFLPAPGEAKPDWWALTQVARRLGHAAAFPYESPGEIFAEHAALSGFENNGRRTFDLSGLAGLSPAAYDALPPVQWPVTAAAPDGTARLFGDGRFSHENGRARLVPIQPRPPVHAVDADYPLWLNTGRLRDQWHTMTRTGRAARLSRHEPLPMAELHPADAARAGIKAEQWVRLETRWGAMVLRARSVADQQPGSVFVPIHWTRETSAHGQVGPLVNPEVDPVSGQPELKHTPVRVVPLEMRWEAVALTRSPLAPGADIEWVRIREAGFWQTHLAGAAEPPDWETWARQSLGTLGDAGEAASAGAASAKRGAGEWLVYRDPAAGRFRLAHLVDDRLSGCLFVAPFLETLDPRRFEKLFAKRRLGPAERATMLSIQAGGPAGPGTRTVCCCNGVTESAIRSALARAPGAGWEEISHATRAGTSCGSCLPEVRALVESAPIGKIA
jgi:assimilatory nitrate reductase catalytic subunit